MLEDIIILDKELSEYGLVTNLSEKAEALLKHQKENWNLVRENFKALENVKTKKYDFGNYYIKTQFNPSRIISTSAKVDKKSIENRKCFLCLENLPAQQKGILCYNKYLILVNPYPIFKQHLTIPNLSHVPQRIENSFSDLLEISKDLGENFFVFYNGPKCGASAPDHLHFQAGLKNSTPLEKFFPMLLSEAKQLFEQEEIKVALVADGLFNFICVQSGDMKQIEGAFNRILNQLKENVGNEDEPLLNIISIYENNMWNIFIIPRRKHRPDQFFAEDDSKFLISPASVDMLGLLITPREKDFDKLTKTDLKDIFNQVLFGKDELKDLLDI